METISKLIKRTEPELLLVFTGEESHQCRRIRQDMGAEVVRLDGSHFLHPAPVVLKGLADLQRLDWQQVGAR